MLGKRVCGRGRGRELGRAAYRAYLGRGKSWRRLEGRARAGMFP